MRWQQGRRSRNIDDRRGGHGGRAPRGTGGRKMGGLMTIGLVVAGLIFGVNPMKLINATGGLGGLSGGSGGGFPQSGGVEIDANAKGDDTEGQFASAVLAYTEDTWQQIFSEYNATYKAPRLVLFENAVRSACGTQSSAVGPFYCPGDDQIYIDLSFWRELKKMGAPGEFARAYVIAHEVAHHVQNLMGVSMKVQRQQRQLPKAQANRLSVLVELQADCYAGVWVNRTQKRTKFLEVGDLEEGLNAAAQVGDDVIMRKAGHRPNESLYTHGTAAQRQEWFARGMETGDIRQCDTLARAGVRL